MCQVVLWFIHLTWKCNSRVEERFCLERNGRCFLNLFKEAIKAHIKRYIRFGRNRNMALLARHEMSLLTLISIQSNFPSGRNLQNKMYLMQIVLFILKVTFSLANDRFQILSENSTKWNQIMHHWVSMTMISLDKTNEHKHLKYTVEIYPDLFLFLVTDRSPLRRRLHCAGTRRRTLKKCERPTSR